MGVIMATLLLCLVLISVLKTVLVQNMIGLHSPCKTSVHCAGVAICVKEVCQCPPEYGAYGSSCVFVEQDGHNVTSPSVAVPPVPLPPAEPSGQPYYPLMTSQPHYPAMTNPPYYPVQPSRPDSLPTALNKIDKPQQPYVNIHWQPAGQQSSAETTNFQPESNSVHLPPPAPALLYAYPGSSCGTRNICISGGICQNGICVCPNGYIQSGFVCVPQPPRQQIQQQQIFSSLNSIQDESYRQMNQNQNQFQQSSNQNMFTYHGANTQNGVNSNQLGLLINAPAQQPTQQVATRTSSTSEPCPPDQVQMGRNCMPQDFVVGILCIDGTECNGVAVCVNSVCTCPPGYIWSSKGCSSANFADSVFRHKTSAGTRPKANGRRK